MIIKAATKPIKGGYFYMYDLDEEMGVWLVKRFKIKNWDQIQKEF
jgi:hypothetical protein